MWASAFTGILIPRSPAKLCMYEAIFSWKRHPFQCRSQVDVPFLMSLQSQRLLCVQYGCCLCWPKVTTRLFKVTQISLQSQRLLCVQYGCCLCWPAVTTRLCKVSVITVTKVAMCTIWLLPLLTCSHYQTLEGDKDIITVRKVQTMAAVCWPAFTTRLCKVTDVITLLENKTALETCTFHVCLSTLFTMHVSCMYHIQCAYMFHVPRMEHVRNSFSCMWHAWTMHVTVHVMWIPFVPWMNHEWTMHA